MFDVLAGSGRDAAAIARLFWIMAGAAAVIWLVVTALLIHGARQRRSPWSERGGLRLIVVGGGVLPIVVLSALLAYGMPMLSRQRGTAPPAQARVTIVGEQWWWRVRYSLPDGTSVDSANEIRLPRGRATEITLTSTNVIHAFWIPALAGKIDMIPGRLTHMTVTPELSGVYRGWCAEYCGASHARMAFVAEVMEPDAFDRWLRAEAQPAAAHPQSDLFMTHGCAACHAIRGTGARARIGPDLTHAGSRHTLAAGAVANDDEAIARWIARPDHVKPGVLMPRFAALPPDHIQRLAEYIRALQ